MRPGEVWRILDHHVDPPAAKLFICALPPPPGLWLRINSRPLWPPQHKLLARHNPYLDHDSYLELAGPFTHLQRVLADAELRGTMARQEIGKVIRAIGSAPTFNDELKATLVGGLAA